MPLYAYLTPKIDFKRKFNHHQSFLYEWRLTARTIRKFRIDHHYESNLESDVRFEIESNHEASQVPTLNSLLSYLIPTRQEYSETAEYVIHSSVDKKTY